MQKILIIYESRYGTTEKMVKKVSLILGPSRYCKVDEFKESYRNFDYIIIGCPIYMEQIDLKVLSFIAENREWLRTKKVAVFSTSLSGKYGEGYLKAVKDLLGESIFHIKALSGKMDKDILNAEDYQALASFFNKIGMSFESIDKSNIDELIEFCLTIKEEMDIDKQNMPEERLIGYIEEFLTSHTTCTLTTGYGKEVRGTPMDYIYKEGILYLFTEGGRKCANILLNPKVSVSVYDSYKSFNEIRGMQLSGEAEFLELEGSEYKEAMKLKRLDLTKIKNMSFILNVLKIKIRYVEILNSKFKEIGYDVKQTYSF